MPGPSRTVRRSDASEPPPGPPRTIRRSAASEPSGKMPGPSRTVRRSDTSEPPPGPSRTIRRGAASEPSGKTPGPSRSYHPPKRHERAVGQDAGPVSIEPTTEAPRASRRASRWARLEPKRNTQAAGQPPRKPSGKLPSTRAGGRSRYRTEPLRLFAVKPLAKGDLGRTILWGCTLLV